MGFFSFGANMVVFRIVKRIIMQNMPNVNQNVNSCFLYGCEYVGNFAVLNCKLE